MFTLASQLSAPYLGSSVVIYCLTKYTSSYTKPLLLELALCDVPVKSTISLFWFSSLVSDRCCLNPLKSMQVSRRGQLTAITHCTCDEHWNDEERCEMCSSRPFTMEDYTVDALHSWGHRTISLINQVNARMVRAVAGVCLNLARSNVFMVFS